MTQRDTELHELRITLDERTYERDQHWIEILHLRAKVRELEKTLQDKVSSCTTTC